MSATAEKIAVMQAYEKGLAIERKLLNDFVWEDCLSEPEWAWTDWTYRVKPEATADLLERDERNRMYAADALAMLPTIPPLQSPQYARVRELLGCIVDGTPHPRYSQHHE
jgi:hypothetical protein